MDGLKVFVPQPPRVAVRLDLEMEMPSCPSWCSYRASLCGRFGPLTCSLLTSWVKQRVVEKVSNYERKF